MAQNKKVPVGIALTLAAMMLLAGCDQLALSPLAAGAYTCTEDDVNVVLVTDWSGSMLPYKQILKDSLIDFSTRLLSNDRNKVGIVMYYGSGELVIDKIAPTNSLSSIKTFVNGLGDPNGQTCTGCGIEEAAHLLLNNEGLNNVVVVFSDGAANTYKLGNGSLAYCQISGGGQLCNDYAREKADYLTRILEYPTKIHTISYENTPDNTATALMTDIAAIGDGSAFVASTSDNLVDIYFAVVNKICTPTCNVNAPNYCQAGEQRCGYDSTSQKAIIQECTDSTGDTCGDSFVTIQQCNAGLECENNACVCPENQCSLGQKWCEGAGYRECELDNNGCTKISDVKSCESGKVCTGGVCGCPSASCNVGTTACVGDTQYRNCGIFSGVCPSWSDSISCPSGQVCDSATGKCLCPNTGYKIGDRRCAGTGYQEYNIYGNDQCPSWGTVTACPPGQDCASGICGCPSSAYDLGERRCVSGNSYQTYDLQGGDVCPSWGAETSCAQGKTCSGGQCVCPTSVYALGDVRCSDNSHYQIWSTYSGSCPSWGNAISCAAGQVCDDGICACPTNQCELGDTRCNGNVVEECQVVGTCTSWVPEQVCSAGTLCGKFSPANCYELFGNIDVIVKSEYALNEPIPVTVQVESPFDLQGTKVYPMLKGDGQIIESFPEALFLINKKATFSFKPATKHYDSIEAVIRLEKDGIIETVTQPINVKQGLVLVLSNVPPNFINEESLISVAVTPSTAAYTLKNIKLTNPNGMDITGELVATVATFRFTPTMLGIHKLTATVTAPGFTETSQEITINVQSKSVTIDYYLDGQDITTIPSGFVDKGEHTFTIKSVESGGVPIDLDNIDLQLIDPYGSQQSLIFMKTAKGEVRADIDLKRAGAEYKIIGFLQKFGTEQVPDININLNNNPIVFRTVGDTGGGGDTTPIDTSLFDNPLIWLALIGGVIALIGGTVWLARRKK